MPADAPKESFDELLDRALRAMKEGYAEQALLPATEAVKADPSRWDARLLLSRVWLEQNRPDRAMSDARAALDLAGSGIPADAMRDANEILARAALAQGDLEEAERALRFLHARPGEYAADARLVALLASKGDAAGAAKTAEEAAGVYRGVLSKRFQAVAEVLASTDALASPDAENALGQLEIDTGLLEPAKKRFQKLFAANPQSEVAQDALRVIAAGGRARPRGASGNPGDGGADAAGVEIETPESLARRSLVLRAAGVLLLLLGIPTVAWVWKNRDVISASGRDPRQPLLAGFALIVAAVICFILDARARERAAAGSFDAR